MCFMSIPSSKIQISPERWLATLYLLMANGLVEEKCKLIICKKLLLSDIFSRLSQIYFINGKKEGLKFRITNRSRNVKSTNLINSAKRRYMSVELKSQDFGFSGGIGRPMRFEHFAGKGPARPAAPFADENAFDNCFARICNP